MGKLTLYAIRHGQSENNLKNMWTGWYDTPLTEDGLKQAEALGIFEFSNGNWLLNSLINFN